VVYQFDDLELDISRRQLSRCGQPIALTKLSFSILQTLVEAAPALVTHDALIDSVWGAKRVVTPENLSQRIKVLRQSLGDDAAHPRYIEGVRGEGFRLIPAVVRLPAQAPDPVAPSPDAPAAAPGQPRPAGKRPARWQALSAAVVIAALSMLWWSGTDRFYHRQADHQDSARKHSSVGVLPFANLSPNPANSFYASGIHEEVLNQLAKLEGLRVISRTSMLRYSDTKRSIPDIARELEVDSVVEGSVRYADNRIRVTVQLVDGRSDVHLWSETYDHELKDIFKIESEVARDVAVALRHAIPESRGTDSKSPPTSSLDAYASYMQGRQAMLLRGSDQLREAVTHFEKAIELDPNYGLAWVGLADSLTLVGMYTEQTIAETFAPRQAAIDRALALDPNSSGAWLALARLRENQNLWEAKNPKLLDEAQEYYLRSIELDPQNAQAYHRYGAFLLHQRGSPEDALPQLRKSVALDPMEPEANGTLILTLWALGRVEETLALTRKRIALEPGYAISYGHLSAYLAKLGRLDEALYWSRAGARVDPRFLAARMQECGALLALGDLAAAENCHDVVVTDFPDKPSAKYWAPLDMYRGQPEPFLEDMLAADALEPSIESNSNLAVAYLYNGKVAEARTTLAQRWPQLFGTAEVDIPSSWYMPPAILTGIILNLDGDTGRANYLFDTVLEKLPSLHRTRGWGYGWTDIAIHVARHDRPKALAALRQAIDVGWRDEWWQLRGPLFTEISKDPEWQALYKELESDVDRQRANYAAHKDESAYWQ
jgi:TolB-like protein/DNA-binding winged helix-turn-helix (wHTH) protein/Tfp pilus assembly protein PilF